MEELNIIVIVKRFRSFLQRFFEISGTEKEKSFTIVVYHTKFDDKVAWENAEVNVTQREQCIKLCEKMKETKAQTSRQFDSETTENLGAVRWGKKKNEGGIVVVAGIESPVCRVLLTKTLHSLGGIDDTQYESIKKELNADELFKKLKR